LPICSDRHRKLPKNFPGTQNGKGGKLVAGDIYVKGKKYSNGYVDTILGETNVTS
jgi:hypothetical protein